MLKLIDIITFEAASTDKTKASDMPLLYPVTGIISLLGLILLYKYAVIRFRITVSAYNLKPAASEPERAEPVSRTVNEMPGFVKNSESLFACSAEIALFSLSLTAHFTAVLYPPERPSITPSRQFPESPKRNLNNPSVMCFIFNGKPVSRIKNDITVTGNIQGRITVRQLFTASAAAVLTLSDRITVKLSSKTAHITAVFCFKDFVVTILIVDFMN